MKRYRTIPNTNGTMKISHCGKAPSGFKLVSTSKLKSDKKRNYYYMEK